MVFPQPEGSAERRKTAALTAVADNAKAASLTASPPLPEPSVPAKSPARLLSKRSGLSGKR